MYPELTRTWFRVVVGVELSLNPVTLAELGVVVQVNKVPVTLEVNVTFVEVLLQMLFEGGVFDRSGVG